MDASIAKALQAAATCRTIADRASATFWMCSSRRHLPLKPTHVARYTGVEQQRKIENEKEASTSIFPSIRWPNTTRA